jgi:hypothetical protein
MCKDTPRDQERGLCFSHCTHPSKVHTAHFPELELDKEWVHDSGNAVSKAHRQCFQPRREQEHGHEDWNEGCSQYSNMGRKKKKTILTKPANTTINPKRERERAGDCAQHSGDPTQHEPGRPVSQLTHDFRFCSILASKGLLKQ